jgi:transcriptional regulator GlxA family with amidase domain
MTIIAYILSMPSARRTVFLAYDGFELLDLSGPAAVFSTANILARKPLYEVVVASPSGGNVASGCGLEVVTSSCAKLAIGRRDTVLVMGAYERNLVAATENVVLTKVARHASKHAERFGSVCSGTFVLAAAGLLAGKRVATHWAACSRLSAAFKEATVEADALYVVDGRLWTSAGVTTGIDMALAMLERDHGSRLMGLVAKQLVVYSHRPGHQSQFSAVLDAQSVADGTFSDLVIWIESKVGESIRVSDMARQAGMSERTFHRKFTAMIGVTPFKFLDGLRLERAKRYLETNDPVKAVAARVGFASESAFRSAFRARFGITPAHHARMHSGAST